MISVRERTK